MQSLHTGLRRPKPAGVAAGAPRTRVRPPLHAWELVAHDMAQAELKTTWTTTLKSRAPMPLPLTLQKGTLDAKLKSMSWQIP